MTPNVEWKKLGANGAYGSKWISTLKIVLSDY
jgi:hypothetical protein